MTGCSDYLGNGIENTGFECRCSKTGENGEKVTRGRILLGQQKGVSRSMDKVMEVHE